ncbi:nitrous oxide reductase family maturation protein NosD [Salinimicrobium sp. TH3]|uniref:nitrous oxide reductase family maturation protein NosD n=1 Tax=Salinimicrobium sp. TH3 TaxID=2997342 RepID=UPI0022737865|nr:nitrous oxide reductase family maturation protein NosD [Salinimicrobium sp. TH3]MCY2687158.1 nitrous oxide reductase family maturation protein NosD [Salinimicrobium sp. TH3]
MKKLILFFFLFFFVSTVAAKEIIVCHECEISSIKQAVELAVSGDTIRIKKGLYKEYEIEIIGKSLTIIGEDYPVIDAEMKGTAFKIKADDFSIEGLHIKNIGTSHTSDNAAILVSRSKNFSIKNNRLSNIFFGILLERSENGIIEGNIIRSKARSQANSGNGIHVWHSKELIIEDNDVQGVRDGIYLEFANNCDIINNVCKENLRYGLHFMFSDHNRYLENLFENNGAGVAVMYSKFIEMERNLFRKNWGSASYGLLLKEINDATLKHNIFEDNTIAISADNTNRIDYLENDFISNGYAIRIRGACYKNVFRRNNFLANSFDVAYTGNINENEFSRNYWSDYTGYDLNKDGIGDVPFRPVKLFSYLVNTTPEAIILLRSMFIGLLDFSEKVSPVFTPAELVDPQPKMKKIKW